MRRFTTVAILLRARRLCRVLPREAELGALSLGRCTRKQESDVQQVKLRFVRAIRCDGSPPSFVFRRIVRLDASKAARDH